jgi:hypothetical protein
MKLPSSPRKGRRLSPAAVAPALAVTDAWCPSCGWIRGVHVRQERGYGSCCTACTRRTGVPRAVEAHWGPCPRCMVQKVYRPVGELQASRCGSCLGIVRKRRTTA